MATAATSTRRSAGSRTPNSSSRRVRGDDPELASYLRIEERELARPDAEKESTDGQTSQFFVAPSLTSTPARPHARACACRNKLDKAGSRSASSRRR